MATVTERTGVVTFKGGPLTVLGDELKAGDKAPDFALLKGLDEVKLSDSAGSARLLVCVPSLDTPVCDTEARKFNEKAASISGAKAYVVSMDLPFAQGRFCSTAGIENLVPLSAHRSDDFGINYGILIKELRLLARSIFVIGKDDKVAYVQIVSEVAEEPNYDEAIEALNKAAG